MKTVCLILMLCLLLSGCGKTPEPTVYSSVQGTRTEITLDATEEGRRLYERMGYAASDEAMYLDIGRSDVG